MKTKSRQILERLYERMQSINAMDGYRTEKIDRVTFELLSPERIKEKNLICIVPGDAPLTRLTADRYTTGQTGQGIDGWRISLLCYLKAGQDDTGYGSSILELEDLGGDVIDCLGNTNWSDLGFVVIVSLVSIQRYPYIAQNCSVLQIIIEVKYDFQENAA